MSLKNTRQSRRNDVYVKEKQAIHGDAMRKLEGWHQTMSGLSDSLDSIEADIPTYKPPRYVFSSDRGTETFTTVGNLTGLPFLKGVQNHNFQCPVTVTTIQHVPGRAFNCKILIKYGDERNPREKVFFNCEDSGQVGLMLRRAHIAVINPNCPMRDIKEGGMYGQVSRVNKSRGGGAKTGNIGDESLHGYSRAEIHLEVTDAALPPSEVCILHGVTSDENFFSRLYDRYCGDRDRDGKRSDVGDGDDARQETAMETADTARRYEKSSGKKTSVCNNNSPFYVLVHPQTANLNTCIALGHLQKRRHLEHCAGLVVAAPNTLGRVDLSVTTALAEHDSSLGYGWHGSGKEQNIVSPLHLQILRHHVYATLEWVVRFVEWIRQRSNMMPKSAVWTPLYEQARQQLLKLRQSIERQIITLDENIAR